MDHVKGEAYGYIKSLPYPKNLMLDLLLPSFASEEWVLNWVESLSPRDARIIELRYKDKLTLAEVGREVGVSGSRIRELCTEVYGRWARRELREGW